MLLAGQIWERKTLPNGNENDKYWAQNSKLKTNPHNKIQQLSVVENEKTYLQWRCRHTEGRMCEANIPFHTPRRRRITLQNGDENKNS